MYIYNINRPVAGYTNICPNLVSTKKSAIQEALATLKHEILHPLVIIIYYDKNIKLVLYIFSF